LEGAYKALRERLGYSPSLTVAQFFSTGFAERKVLFCQDVLRLVQRIHGELIAGTRSGCSESYLVGRSRHQGVERRMVAVRCAQGAAPHDQKAFRPLELSGAECLEVAPKEDEEEAQAEDEEALDGPQPPPEPSRPPPEPQQRLQASGPGRAELEALCGLLSEIRGALDQRFLRLERRVEAYAEGADARAALLEGEVRILSAKLQEALPLGDHGMGPKPAPSSGAAARSSGNCGGVVQPPQPPVERWQAFGWEALGEQAPGSSLRGATAPESFVGEAVVAAGQLGPSSATSPPLCSQRRQSAGEDDDFREEVVGKPGLSYAAAVELDTQALLERLTCKFQDTQALLAEAQAKIDQGVGPGWDGAGTGVGAAGVSLQGLSVRSGVLGGVEGRSL